MKRTLYFVMALALVLGLAQCKKEQLLEPTNEGNVVNITLNVDGGASTGSATNGSRAEVDPPHVTFVEGDTILVASDGKYVGYLVHNGSTFNGNITNPTVDQPLYFYFLGNKIKVSTLTAGTTDECTVNISDQTGYPALPVISMAPSEETYPSNENVYTASLHNKCSLMKFNVTTPSVAPICITGMNNEVTVNFMQAASDADNNGFSYGMSAADGGLIKMKGGSGSPAVKWAIVLPNSESTTTTAYTEDGNYIASISTTIDPIVANNYYDSGIGMNVNTINPTGPLATPLTFEAKTAGATVKLKKGLSAPTVTLEYSTDGSTWTSYSVTTSGVAITLNNIGDKVMFRGTNTKFAKNSTDKNYNYFSLGGDCYVYGNVMSLINSTDFATTTAFADESSYNFCYLFKNCSRLYNHPTKSIVLPATTLATGCYCRMFNGCTNLTAIPDLPATKLADNCYGFMFYGCTNLTAVPDLPATILANSCYLHMFENCSGLTTVPTTLPVTTLAYSCYQGMFKNCTSLITAPELPAPTLAENCYQDMFWGCSALTSVTCLATDISASGCVDYWFSSVTTTGTFYKASTMSGWTVGTNVPANWTIVDAN